MGSHVTWYARGLADGAGIALDLPPEWTVTAIRDTGATDDDYATYARARAEALQRTRKVIDRRRAAERRRTHAAIRRIGQELRWLFPDPLRLVTPC